MLDERLKSVNKRKSNIQMKNVRKNYFRQNANGTSKDGYFTGVENKRLQNRWAATNINCSILFDTGNLDFSRETGCVKSIGNYRNLV